MNISYIRIWETLAVISDHGEMIDLCIYINT